jgi:predicted DNA-binding transcriptional regulator YafY
MYLQTRGRTTSERLALEFEVSRRTIIRDLYALRVAGFPVYTERGPQGGCYLHEEYRNTLTQLTADEIAALFLSSIQEPLRDLGLSEPLRGALLKLSAALPEPRQAARSRIAERIVIDSKGWSDRRGSIGRLGLLHQAAMEDRWVLAEFDRPFGVTTSRRIAPYGLVAKAGEWFVVWVGEDERLRVDRVSDVLAALPQEERFERPAAFALEAFWVQWCERQQADRPTFEVSLRVRADALEFVQDALGVRKGVFYGVPVPAEQWVAVDVSFGYLDEARRALLELGGAVEVVGPESLRRSMIDFADQIRGRYASSTVSARSSNRFDPMGRNP